jgi:stringent starvation protein B
LSELSTKPYLIRAIYEWCADSGLTPYLAVKVDAGTQVPVNYVKNGEIVLNLSVDAVKDLYMGNDEITCGGRFGGVPHDIIVPVSAVIGIFAKETGQGLVFQGQESAPISASGKEAPPEPPTPTKPTLRVVK